MNGFYMEEIENILNYPPDLEDSQIPKEVFDVIYSLGRDAENEEEYVYAYGILLELCKRKSRHVRAYSILAMSLMARSGVLQREDLVPIIENEWNGNDMNEWSRNTIRSAVDDFNLFLGWNVKV